MSSSEEVRQRIESSLNCTFCEVIDVSGGCGASYSVKVVSPDFEAKPLLQRQRMVNNLFVEDYRGAIHSMTIRTLTPEQFASEQF